jgi:hypothetical protein
MITVGEENFMKGKEWDAANLEGAHKLDISIGNGLKVCYNPIKRCWVGHGKKYILEERDARRYAQKFKEVTS